MPPGRGASPAGSDAAGEAEVPLASYEYFADRDPLHADHGKPGTACQRVQPCSRHHEARFAGKSSLGAIDLGGAG